MRITHFDVRIKYFVGLLTTAAALFVAQGFSLDSSGVRSGTHVVEADATYKSCFTVMHEYAPTTTESSQTDLDYVASAGIDGSSYIVEYRLRQISNGSWTSWTTPTETAGSSTSVGTYSYGYDTGSQNGSTYDEVEWRVITSSHSGTNVRTSASMVSVDDANIIAGTMLYTSGPCHGDETINQSQWDGAIVGYEY